MTQRPDAQILPFPDLAAARCMAEVDAHLASLPPVLTPSACQPLAPFPAPARRAITYQNITGKVRRRFGVTHPAPVAEGQHADVVPGSSVRLYGEDPNRCRWDAERRQSVQYTRHYDLTFRVGDRAVYGSYNLVYTGTITAIGKQTVTITEDGYERDANGETMRDADGLLRTGPFGQAHRLELYEFNWRNNDYDAEKIARENADTMQRI